MLPRHGSGLLHLCSAHGMATPSSDRLNTISYPRGTVTAPRGLLEYCFGPLEDALRWELPGTAADAVTGRRRRRYGTRQRSSARAGEAMKVVLDNGQKYTMRVTGTHLDFIDFAIGRMLNGKIVGVFSERGTDYSPQARNNI
jgi:hypothetical protein